MITPDNNPITTSSTSNVDQALPQQFDEKSYQKLRNKKKFWFFSPILLFVTVIVLWGLVSVVSKTFGVDVNNPPVLLRIFNLIVPILIIGAMLLVPIGIILGIYYADKQERFKTSGGVGNEQFNNTSGVVVKKFLSNKAYFWIGIVGIIIGVSFPAFTFTSLISKIGPTAFSNSIILFSLVIFGLLIFFLIGILFLHLIIRLLRVNNSSWHQALFLVGLIPALGVVSSILALLFHSASFYSLIIIILSIAVIVVWIIIAAKVYSTEWWRMLSAYVLLVLSLLIIVAIIGFVASIILASLNAARQKALSLQNISPQSQLQATAPNNSLVGISLLASEPYIDTVAHFKIYPPQGWKIEKTNNQTGVLVTFSKMDQSNTSGAKIEIRLNSGTNQSLDQYIQTMNAVFSKIFPNFKQTENQKVNINGRDAMVNGATFSLDNVDGKIIQLTTIKDGKIWVVVATIAPLSFAAQYEDVINASSRSLDLN